MDFLQLAATRRSVRAYSDRRVSREDLLRCLEAARLAPSACNSQPWYFIVIDDPSALRKIGERIFSGVYGMNAFAKKAQALVAIVSDRSKFLSRLGGQVRDTRYSLIDIGIAGEHLALQAAELGIGTCWIGWFDEKQLKKELGLSRLKKIHVVFAMGYAADEPRTKNRKSLDEIHSFGSRRVAKKGE